MGVPKEGVKPILLSQSKQLRNPHFWVVLVLLVFITIVYYNWKTWFPPFWYWFIIEFNNDSIGTVYLIPFIYAVVFYRWRTASMVWLLSLLLLMPCLLYYQPQVGDLLRNIGTAAVPLVTMLAIASQIEWRRTQKTMLAERDRRREAFISEIIKAQENERYRLAQELHDETIQELLVTANQIQYMISRIRQKPISTHQLERVKNNILDVMDGVRRFTHDLRPSILDNLGFIPAIRWLAERLEDGAGINTMVRVDGIERKLHKDIEVCIFRIAQEVLHNIRRHSKAKEAIITLTFISGAIVLVIRDDGLGFLPPRRFDEFSAQGKLGLAGIERRAKSLGGSCYINSGLGKGTSVTVKLRC